MAKTDQSKIVLATAPDAKALARQFLLGELMEVATKQLRTIDTPWLRMPEAAQKTVLRKVQDACEEAVRKTVEIIASDDRTRFRAEVESVTFKDGVKATLAMPNTASSHELADVTKGTVLIVIEDPARYLTVGPNAPKAQPNQPELPVGDSKAKAADTKAKK